MSRRPPMALIAALAFSGTTAWAQDDAARAAAEAALRHAMDTSVAAFCPQAPETDDSAMTLDVQGLPASALSPGAGAATPQAPVRIGPYAYEGKGTRITSDDPRFMALQVARDGSGPRLPNGDRLVIWNLVGATSAGICRLALTRSTGSIHSQVGMADEAGARPVLQDYRAGPSLPFGRGRFLGLMHPESGEARTLLVSFAAGPDHRTRVEAEVPLALQSVRPLPPIHGGPWSLLVMGRQADGSIVQADLRADYPRD